MVGNDDGRGVKRGNPGKVKGKLNNPGGMSVGVVEITSDDVPKGKERVGLCAGGTDDGGCRGWEIGAGMEAVGFTAARFLAPGGLPRRFGGFDGGIGSVETMGIVGATERERGD